MWDVLATRNNFAYIIVFFLALLYAFPYLSARPVAHDLILLSVCARRAYPRRFLGRVGRTPLSHTLTWVRVQMPSRKGVKNHLYSTGAYQCRPRPTAPRLKLPRPRHLLPQLEHHQVPATSQVTSKLRLPRLVLQQAPTNPRLPHLQRHRMTPSRQVLSSASHVVAEDTSPSNAPTSEL